MSDLPDPFEVEGIKVAFANAPPVYAPGGPVSFVFDLPEGSVDALALSEVACEAAARGAVLLIVQCPVVAVVNESLLLTCGFTFASSWYFGPLSQTLTTEAPIGVRAAIASDVPRILEIGEKKRKQYEGFSPVFWKMAPTPREEFAPYITSQVKNADNIALVHEVNDEIRGYLIAQCRNLAEGYVDDYAIAESATAWSETGVVLLAEAGRQAALRKVLTFSIVTAHADAPKRAAIEELGFVRRKNWLVRAL